MAENEERKNSRSEEAAGTGGEDAELERRLMELLEAGELVEQGDETEEQLRRLSPRYEVRIQTTFDPIVEETVRFRQFGTELDNRYDKYMERAQARATEAGSGADTGSAKPPGGPASGEAAVRKTAESEPDAGGAQDSGPKRTED
ncbi:hypothetical protein [Paenibacillus spiritus]|uniref:hypothetical protein n=1 Tax=Paenibacillus spiritus TaxID=2496557 RepID=UPI00295E4570|nr:hypothetical protein [Paenibacillus spiritus]